MPLAAWKESYRTGDANVDHQHQELFTLINGLHGAIAAGSKREPIIGMLEHFGTCITTHFQTEERLMLASGYPSLASHKAKHDELCRHAAKVIDDYRSGRAVLTIALSRFLADWLRHHIDGEDKVMIRFLQQRLQP